MIGRIRGFSEFGRNSAHHDSNVLTVRHSETQSPTLMRPTTPGGEIRCPQKNETGYFECPRLHNSAETIPEP